LVIFAGVKLKLEKELAQSLRFSIHA